MITLQFTPFPVLQTERLILRQVTALDAPEILVFRSDDRILKYLGNPKAKNESEALEFIMRINTNVTTNTSIYWGIQHHHHPQLIGTICLWNIEPEKEQAEIGYVLHPDWQGKGLMQEAAEEVIDYGFNTMQLKAIVADLHAQNSKSLKLLERFGFTRLRSYEEMVVYTLQQKNR